MVPKFLCLRGRFLPGQAWKGPPGPECSVQRGVNPDDELKNQVRDFLDTFPSLTVCDLWIDLHFWELLLLKATGDMATGDMLPFA